MNDSRYLEAILNHITRSGIYVIRQDTHEILYFNEQVKNKTPDIQLGQICHEVWAGSCENCPIQGIGDKETNTTINYNDPFGKIVDITATRILWGDEIPAFVISISPHMSSQKEQEAELERQRMFMAISQVYEMVASVNLTKGTYSIVECGTRQDQLLAREGGIEALIAFGADKAHADFREAFLETFQIKRLLERFACGDKSPFLEYLQLTEDGNSRWIMTRVIQMDNPFNDDILAVVLCRNVNRVKQIEEKLKVQEQLEQERRYYQVAVESTQDIMFEYAVAQDTFIAYEPEWEGGVKQIRRVELPGFLKGMREYDVVHPDYEQKIRKIFGDGDTESLEIRMRPPDMGDYRWFQISGNAIYEDGKIVHMVGMLRDINEYKVLELRREYLERVCNFTVRRDYNLVATLDVSTGIYEISFTTLGDVYVLDRSGDYYTTLPLVARVAVHPSDRKAFVKQLDLDVLVRQLGGESEQRFYFRILSNDRTYRWKCVRYTYFEGSQRSILFTVQDVQEVREAKNKEMMAGQVFTAAMRELYDQIFEANLTTDTLYELQCGENGITRNLETKGLREILLYREKHLIHPDHQEKYRENLDVERIPDMLRENPHLYFEVLRKMENGSYHWFSIQVQYLTQDEEGYRVLIYLRDIDETRREYERNQQVLRDALLLAENANHAKTDFISRMSHDIRTPMNAIIGMTAIAGANLHDRDKISDCLNKIGISAKFLLSLINDILDMSKIESGKVILSNREFDIQNMIRSIITVIYPQAMERNLDFNIYIDQKISASYIGDELRLNQILMNLLGNALKYTPEGGRIFFRMELIDVRGKTAHIRMEVEDTGVGISEEFQKRIFEPFEQEETDAGRVFKGTGLGMTITKNFVHLMGGKIWVESRLGVGSKFTVELPLGITEEETGAFCYVEEAVLQNLRVLIVDDDLVACEHTQTILQGLGMQANFVNSGEKALEEFKRAADSEETYDVAFIDWKMPGMDGVETVRHIREESVSRPLLIVMSAYDWAQIEYEARTVGVDCFISKPMFPESVRTTLLKALSTEFGAPKEKKEQDYQFHGERILLVEDNEINLEIAQTLLEMKNLTVDTACNGQEAVDKFQQSLPGYYKVILMDIRMPVMDGIEATQTIRALDKFDAKTVPIVAMTANVFEKDEESAEQIGMNGYLIKPIDTNMLYWSIDQLLYRGAKKLFS